MKLFVEDLLCELYFVWCDVKDFAVDCTECWIEELKWKYQDFKDMFYLLQKGA